MIFEKLTDKGIWRPVSEKPVLLRGGDGAWDSYGVMHACLLPGNDGYRLWYEGRSKQKEKVEGHIVFGSEVGYAESKDGSAWEKHPEPVLTPGGPGTWDSHHVFYPTVLRHGEELRMYYHGNDAVINRCSIGMAVSKDGLSWRRHESNPVLDLNADQEHGLINVACPNVVPKAEGCGMVYIKERPLSDGTGNIIEIAAAHSADGKLWEDDGTVISLEEERMCISYPSLLAVENRYLLWAWVFSHDPEKQEMNHLRLFGSADLLAWVDLLPEGWFNTWTDNLFTRRAFIPRIFEAGENLYFMFYPIRFEKGVCDTGLAIAEI